MAIIAKLPISHRTTPVLFWRGITRQWWNLIAVWPFSSTQITSPPTSDCLPVCCHLPFKLYLSPLRHLHRHLSSFKEQWHLLVLFCPLAQKEYTTYVNMSQACRRHKLDLVSHPWLAAPRQLQMLLTVTTRKGRFLLPIRIALERGKVDITHFGTQWDSFNPIIEIFRSSRYIIILQTRKSLRRHQIRRLILHLVRSTMDLIQ